MNEASATLPTWPSRPQESGASRRIHLRASPGVRRLLLGLAVMLAALIPGLGLFGPSPDHENYRILYDWASEASLTELVFGNDPAYFLFSRAAVAAGLSFQGFLLLLALATAALHAVLLSRLKTDTLVLVVLYASYLFWLHDYTQVRFALAFALVFLGLTGRSSARWGWCLLGALVHASVLLVVVLYLVLSGRKLVTIALAACTALLIASGLLDGLLATLTLRAAVYEDILALGMFEEINRLSLMPMVQALAMIGCWRAAREQGREFQREWWLAACGLVGFYGLSDVPVLAFRVYEMFIPFFLILVSRLWRQSVPLQLLLPLYVLLGLRVSFFAPDALFPLFR